MIRKIVVIVVIFHCHYFQPNLLRLVTDAAIIKAAMIVIFKISAIIPPEPVNTDDAGVIR
jgi:hypothetical protein